MRNFPNHVYIFNTQTRCHNQRCSSVCVFHSYIHGRCGYIMILSGKNVKMDICGFELHWIKSCWFLDARKNITRLCSTCSSASTLMVFQACRTAGSHHFFYLASSQFHYSHKHHVFSLHRVEALALIVKCRVLFLLSQLRSEEVEELGQQPWACCCHRFTAFEWFSSLPHVCVDFPLSVSPLPLCLPSTLPLCFDLSSSLYPHNLFYCGNLGSVLL